MSFQKPIVNNTPALAPTDNNELRAAIKKIIKYKKIASITFIAIFLGSLVYALLATPEYKSKISFLPPTIGDVAPLKIPTITEQPSNIDVNQELVKKIYGDFEKNLNSIKIRHGIFDKLQIIKTLDNQEPSANRTAVIFNKFNENFSLEKPNQKKDVDLLHALHLNLKGKDPQIISDILNQLSMQVLAITKQEAIRDISEQVVFKKEQLKREINGLREQAEHLKQDEIAKLQEVDKVEREKLEDQIRTLRESAKTKRADRITELTEAAKIAEGIGLIEKSALLDNGAISTNDKNAFYTEVNTQPQPLYLRGSKALRAEIKELTERTSDDPFIAGLRDLQDKVELLKVNRQVEALKARQNNDAFIEGLRSKESELALLEAFKIDPTQVNVAILDQAAYPPEKPEKPKRSLIVALGAVGGLFLGIVAALIANFWHSFRLEEEGKA